MHLLRNIQKSDPEENVKHKIMKKPYLDYWQRQHIIHDTHLGNILRLNIELKKCSRQMIRSFPFQFIINSLSKKL